MKYIKLFEDIDFNKHKNLLNMAKDDILDIFQSVIDDIGMDDWDSVSSLGIHSGNYYSKPVSESTNISINNRLNSKIINEEEILNKKKYINKLNELENLMENCIAKINNDIKSIYLDNLGESSEEKNMEYIKYTKKLYDKCTNYRLIKYIVELKLDDNKNPYYNKWAIDNETNSFIRCSFYINLYKIYGSYIE